MLIGIYLFNQILKIKNIKLKKLSKFFTKVTDIRFYIILDIIRNLIIFSITGIIVENIQDIIISIP